jgi:hypothetical protein
MVGVSIRTYNHWGIIASFQEALLYKARNFRPEGGLVREEERAVICWPFDKI